MQSKKIIAAYTDEVKKVIEETSGSLDQPVW